MGYGEYGGDGSVQVSNLLRAPDNGAGNSQMVPNSRAGWAPANAANPKRLSKRASDIYGSLPLGTSNVNTSIGLDKYPLPADDAFAVTVYFQSDAERDAAEAQFQAARTNNQRCVTFRLKVLPDTPGQIQIAWGEDLAGQQCTEPEAQAAE